MDNPFNPQNVKLVNYHPEQIEKKKIDNITNNMYKVNNSKVEYSKPKSYGDVLKKTDNYSNHINSKPSYSDAFKGNNNEFKNN